MKLIDYLAPTITAKLATLQLGHERIEEKLAEISAEFLFLKKQGELIMQQIAELKELADRDITPSKELEAKLDPPIGPSE